MKLNPLIELESFGQSIWIDYLSRGAIKSGEIKKMIDQDGVSGVTSNPSIFEKAILGSQEYDADIRTLARLGKDVNQVYLELTVKDIQDTADLFYPIYDRTEGRDGFVSLEVSPTLAHDTAGTIAEARKLWGLVDRPNLMVKVPGTQAGIPAIRQLVSEGINVNVTLLFGLPRYREIALAYLQGLEDLARQGKPLDHVASVASFFLSRIDTLLDPQMEQTIARGGSQANPARKLHGMAAILSAREAYAIYQDLFAGPRFDALAQLGARPQRVLWASTSTKNPNYPDTKYVEPLIGPQTINTLPVETLDAYRDHGQPQARLLEKASDTTPVQARLKEINLDLDQATQKLEDEGVDKFMKAFSQTLAAVAEKVQAARELA